MLLVLTTMPVALGARGEPLGSILNPRVQNGTWVTDMAGALRADTVARINDTIGKFEQASGIEMAVVVVRSLDGVSIEETTAGLFKLWGIGKKDRDIGILFLWSAGDRRVRVEVGYGLEGILPDAKVGAILDTYVIPSFKSGEFDAGIVAGVDALLAAARSETVPLPVAGSGSTTASWAAGSPPGCRYLAPSRWDWDRSLGCAGGGVTDDGSAHSVRRAWSCSQKAKTMRGWRKGRWQKSELAVWTTTCGTVRRAPTTLHCATRSG